MIKKIKHIFRLIAASSSRVKIKLSYDYIILYIYAGIGVIIQSNINI